MPIEKAKVLATAATVGKKAQVWLTSMEDALKVEWLYALCSSYLYVLVICYYNELPCMMSQNDGFNLDISMSILHSHESTTTVPTLVSLKDIPLLSTLSNPFTHTL